MVGEEYPLTLPLAGRDVLPHIPSNAKLLARQRGCGSDKPDSAEESEQPEQYKSKANCEHPYFVLKILGSNLFYTTQGLGADDSGLE